MNFDLGNHRAPQDIHSGMFLLLGDFRTPWRMCRRRGTMLDFPFIHLGIKHQGCCVLRSRTHACIIIPPRRVFFSYACMYTSSATFNRTEMSFTSGNQLQSSGKHSARLGDIKVGKLRYIPQDLAAWDIELSAWEPVATEGHRETPSHCFGSSISGKDVMKFQV